MSRKLMVTICLLLALSACAPQPVPGTVTVTLPAGLVPYHSATPPASPTPFLVLTQALLPSSTPLIYSVQLNDTLLGIAQKFGVSLDALMTANPGADPNALTVGMKLIIPVGGTVGEPTPTPVPVSVLQSACHATTDGGAWCLALVQNPYAEVMENVSVLFTLLDSSGVEIASQTAFTPLNIIPPGRMMPVGAFFPAPVPPGANASLQILTSNRMLPGDQRYLPVITRNVLIQVAADGLSAQATGQVVLETPGTSAGVTWVLAMAFSAEGSLVGFKRWEAPAAFTGGTPFDLQVYTVSTPIERVELIVEARP